MKEFGSEKIIFDKMTAVRTLTIFSLIGLFYIIDSAFMGGSTPTTAFDGAIWYFAYTNICMKESGWKKNYWQNDSYENLDNYFLIWLLYMHG